MTRTPTSGMDMLQREHADEAAKIAVLRRAADQGWSDLAAGRFDDVEDESLDGVVGQLGRRAPEALETG